LPNTQRTRSITKSARTPKRGLHTSASGVTMRIKSSVERPLKSPCDVTALRNRSKCLP
jgi:hypothetical protein